MSLKNLFARLLKQEAGNKKAISLALLICELNMQLKYSLLRLYEYFKFSLLLRIIIIFIYENKQRDLFI